MERVVGPVFDVEWVMKRKTEVGEAILEIVASDPIHRSLKATLLSAETPNDPLQYWDKLEICSGFVRCHRHKKDVLIETCYGVKGKDCDFYEDRNVDSNGSGYIICSCNEGMTSISTGTPKNSSGNVGLKNRH